MLRIPNYLLWGAGSLYVDAEHKKQLKDTPGFPKEAQPVAVGMGKALKRLKIVVMCNGFMLVRRQVLNLMEQRQTITRSLVTSMWKTMKAKVRLATVTTLAVLSMRWSQENITKCKFLFIKINFK